MILTKRPGALFALLALAIGGCAAPRDGKPPERLFHLRGTLLRPLDAYADAGFSIESGRVEYHNLRGARGGAPPADDEAAVHLSRAWITEHFGALGDGVSLRPIEIDRKGDTIDVEFELLFRGVPVDTGWGIRVTLDGGVCTSATVEIYRLDLLPETERPVLSAEDARAHLLEVVRRHAWPGSRDGLLESYRAAVPVLHYRWRDFPESGNYEVVVLAPTWAFDERIMVDAHSGGVWDDD